MKNLQENERIFISLSKSELMDIIIDCVNACLKNPPLPASPALKSEPGFISAIDGNLPIRDPKIVEFLSTKLVDTHMGLYGIPDLAIRLSEFINYRKSIVKDYKDLTLADLLYWKQDCLRRFYLRNVGKKSMNKISDFYEKNGVLIQNPLSHYMDFELIGYTELTKK